MEPKTQLLGMYVYKAADRVWRYDHLRHTTTEKHDNNKKVDISDVMVIIRRDTSMSVT